MARQLGVSRDSIHRWIRAGDLDRDVDEPRYGPRPAVVTKLEAYTPIIDARTAAYPELSAVRLLDEIRAAGYTGGYSQLKAWCDACARHRFPSRSSDYAGGPSGPSRFCPVSISLGIRHALLVVLGVVAGALVSLPSPPGYGDPV